MMTEAQVRGFLEAKEKELKQAENEWDWLYIKDPKALRQEIDILRGIVSALKAVLGE